MTFDQAVAVVKEAMRQGVEIAVGPCDDDPSSFMVGVVQGPGPEVFESYSAALDALDRARV